MERLRVGGPVGVLVAMAILTGCGGTGTTASVPSAMMPSVVHHATSSSGDLLYVIRGHKHGAAVFVFSYPQRESIGSLSGLTKPTGLCSDTNGDVFVTEDGEVLEYSHGGTSPIQTLTAIGNYCAWDPLTGNLAVVGEGKVQIFSNATGSPEVYSDSPIGFSCVYDNQGNLFIVGLNSTGHPVLIRFANKQFTPITLSSRLYYMSDLQWDGKYLVIDDFDLTGTLYRVKVSGSEGTIESATSLNGEFYGNQAWLQGKTFISSVVTGRNVYRQIFYWSYPAGKLLKKFKPKGGGPIRAITISVAPSRKWTFTRTRVEK